GAEAADRGANCGNNKSAVRIGIDQAGVDRREEVQGALEGLAVAAQPGDRRLLRMSQPLPARLLLTGKPEEQTDDSEQDDGGRQLAPEPIGHRPALSRLKLPCAAPAHEP